MWLSKLISTSLVVQVIIVSETFPIKVESYNDTVIFSTLVTIDTDQYEIWSDLCESKV